ncbi:MAG: hypothetical protein JJ855_03965 [Rhodospirillales bacterium]|nr:hypothetical protein [Rhodospirillales bacterium]
MKFLATSAMIGLLLFGGLSAGADTTADCSRFALKYNAETKQMECVGGKRKRGGGGANVASLARDIQRGVRQLQGIVNQAEQLLSRDKELSQQVERRVQELLTEARQRTRDIQRKSRELVQEQRTRQQELRSEQRQLFQVQAQLARELAQKQQSLTQQLMAEQRARTQELLRGSQ